MAFGNADFYSIGFHWAARPEALDVCAERLRRFLAEIKPIDPIFGRWKHVGPETPPFAPPRDIESLTKILSSGALRRDDNREPMQCGGYSVGLAAVGGNGRMNLRILCGCGSPSLGNHIGLELPVDKLARDRLLNPPTAVQLIEIGIHIWEPNRALIASSQMFAAQRKNGDRSLDAGWITFLSSEVYERIEHVEMPAELRQIKEGQLVIAAPHPSLSADGMASLARIGSLIRKKPSGSA